MKKKPDEKDQPRESSQTGEMTVQSTDEVELHYQPQAPPAPEDKRIHQRRPMPLVPEGTDESDEDQSPCG